jgi:uncharacterized membrane protein YcaP (DUF421 family)
VLAQIRQHGFEKLEDVSEAYIEGDGRFSVIGRDRAKRPPQSRPAQQLGR